MILLSFLIHQGHYLINLESKYGPWAQAPTFAFSFKLTNTDSAPHGCSLEQMF